MAAAAAAGGAANKKLLVAVLCLALVAAVAAGRNTEPSPAWYSATCTDPLQLRAVYTCARLISCKYKEGNTLFTPHCCDELARSPLGCACFVRDIVKKATGIDIKRPFCVDGSGCPDGY